MIFNDGMTIWILAVLIIASAALAGWRVGAIRASIALVGNLVAALLAVPGGKIFQPLLPHLGASNPVLAWTLAPIVGFAVISIAFKIGAQTVHKKAEVFYKYNAGELRLALWERVNTRLGICLGLLNGAIYFVLTTFFIFNLSYWTTQVGAAPNQPLVIRTVNALGADLQATGLSRTGAAVGTLPVNYYKLGDLAGFLMQNPQTATRLALYPGLVSLWERTEMQPLVTDSTLTNALAGGASLNDVLNTPSVQDFLKNKALSQEVENLLETNYNDLLTYLNTGKSPKYAGEKIVGRWEFNPAVTVAWLRQSRPKMPASEMRAIRAWMTQAYSTTRVIVAGDNKIFVKNLPKLKSEAGQAPTTELNNWNGDWTRNDAGYDVHVAFNGEDKFLTATAEDVRLSVKDGKNLLVFDRVD